MIIIIIMSSSLMPLVLWAIEGIYQPYKHVEHRNNAWESVDRAIPTFDVADVAVLESHGSSCTTSRRASYGGDEFADDGTPMHENVGDASELQAPTGQPTVQTSARVSLAPQVASILF
jgi:hypothetical protein